MAPKKSKQVVNFPDLDVYRGAEKVQVLDPVSVAKPKMQDSVLGEMHHIGYRIHGIYIQFDAYVPGKFDMMRVISQVDEQRPYVYADVEAVVNDPKLDDDTECDWQEPLILQFPKLEPINEQDVPLRRSLCVDYDGMHDPDTNIHGDRVDHSAQVFFYKPCEERRKLWPFAESANRKRTDHETNSRYFLPSWCNLNVPLSHRPAIKRFNEFG